MVKKDWPDYDLDGWIYAHNAIRLDINDTINAVTRIYESNSLNNWEAEYLHLWWRRVGENIIQHHDHEERFFFPLLQTRIDFPEKISSDHLDLMDLLSNVTKRIVHLTTYSQIEDVLSDLEILKNSMFEHLKEEEEKILPLMRENFTPGDLKPTMNKMINEFKWYELPHFYRQLKLNGHYDKGAIMEHAKEVLEINSCVFNCCIWKDFKRYDK